MNGLLNVNSNVERFAFLLNACLEMMNIRDVSFLCCSAFQCQESAVCLREWKPNRGMDSRSASYKSAVGVAEMQ